MPEGSADSKPQGFSGSHLVTFGEAFLRKLRGRSIWSNLTFCPPLTALSLANIPFVCKTLGSKNSYGAWCHCAGRAAAPFLWLQTPSKCCKEMSFQRNLLGSLNLDSWPSGRESSGAGQVGAPDVSSSAVVTSAQGPHHLAARPGHSESDRERRPSHPQVSRHDQDHPG